MKLNNTSNTHYVFSHKHYPHHHQYQQQQQQQPKEFWRGDDNISRPKLTKLGKSHYNFHNMIKFFKNKPNINSTKEQRRDEEITKGFFKVGKVKIRHFPPVIPF